MLEPNDLPLVCLPDDLSDEAAAQIADFLTQLALTFENAHYSQIRRHQGADRVKPHSKTLLREWCMEETFRPQAAAPQARPIEHIQAKMAANAPYFDVIP